MFSDKPQKESHDGLFQLGDLVRIRTIQKVGENKLQKLHFSPQIFEIVGVITNRRTYKIKNARNPNDIRIVPDRHCRLVLKNDEKEIIENEKPKLDEAYENYRKSLIKSIQNRASRPKKTADKFTMQLRNRSRS